MLHSHAGISNYQTGDPQHSTTDGFIKELEQLLHSLARVLVDETHLIEVNSRTEDAATTFSLKVSPEDVGKVIGKQGRTARSLRTILLSAATKQKTRISLEIGELSRELPTLK